MKAIAIIGVMVLVSRMAMAGVDPLLLTNAPVVVAQKDGTLVAPARVGIMVRNQVDAADRVRKLRWPDDAKLETRVPSVLAWRTDIPAAGEYDVIVSQKGGFECFGFVSVGTATLKKDWLGGDAFRFRNMGRLTLSAGLQALTFSYDHMTGGYFTNNMDMNVEAIILSPVANGMAKLTQKAFRAYLEEVVPPTAVEKLVMPPIFSDHMVLQRDVPVPVWGQAPTGTTVTVAFAGKTKVANVDKFGRWRITLKPMKANATPQEMIITCADLKSQISNLKLNDVLIGDVWLGSGQSNMDMPVDGWGRAQDREVGVEALVGTNDYPLIRISSNYGKFPGRNGGWVVGVNSNMFKTSALMACSVIRLQRELGIPFGIIVRASGGSPLGPWVEPDAVTADVAVQQQIADYAAHSYDKDLEAYLARCKAEKRMPSIGYVGAPLLPGLSWWRHDTVGGLWDQFINPLVPYAIKGVVWDQGEAETQVGGATLETLQPVLVGSWRKAWGQGEFPFIHVMKNQYDTFTKQAIGRLPNAALVSNKGLDQQLHPVDKEKYGERIALMIMGKVYGKKGVYCDPRFQKMTVKGDKAIIDFDFAGKGLVKVGEKDIAALRMAGDDKVFHDATGVIEDGHLVVTCAKVSKPVAVRYDGQSAAVQKNFITNETGIPADSFQTDDWRDVK